ncbi:MAG: DUF5702 domain-containing protein [Lachnospiraceae bacterium]|nr:DUF5702 domain-containing protein [Lachnospiraceae bacterium]
MKRRTDGSICVFLALVLLLIVSLILVFLEGARRSAANSYASMLLKTATESVMGDYYGPLFEEYHIFAIDSGFGNKTGDTDELERKLKKYIGENVWDYELKSIRAYGTGKLMERSAEEFITQAAAYEKYGVAQDILEEVLDRVKNLGNQTTITKIMERKMGIEDELSVIDMYTLDLMKWIDGVNLTLGTKASSLLGYSIENRFIKRFFVNDVSMSSTGINKPSVYEKLQDRYVDPVKLTESYEQSLKEHKKKLEESDESLRRLDAAKETLRACKEQIDTKEDILEVKNKELEDLKEEISGYEKAIQDTEKLENKKTAVTRKKKYQRQKERAEKKAAEAEGQINTLNVQTEELKQNEQRAEQDVNTLEAALEEVLTEIMYQEEDCRGKANELLTLYCDTLELLQYVCETVDKVGEKQAAVGPLVDGYESFLKTVDPILSKDMKESLTDSLDYMKAYIGRGDGRIKTTDFAAIKSTALYDIDILKKVDVYAFVWPEADTLSNISGLLNKVQGAGTTFKDFSYSGFNFDYSELKESVIENKLVAEFEKNISDGYLKLFLKSGTEVSENSLISELLPSLWYEIEEVNAEESEQNPIGDPSDKGGGELLKEADEGSGLSAIGELLENGLEAGSKKFLTAAYLVHHFKSFTDKSVKGDTVLDYELEYILSGLETDKANLSAAATKIMLLRLAICTVYTMSNSKLRTQAEVFATSIVGFTGLPFLITIVKYLVLFLWAAAQSVIETAAIMRGKKVPVIPNEKSFCLTLAELPSFASLIEEKADNFSESEIYLDYENYLLVLLLIQGKQTQAARTMDVIQENIRYKYNDDFLMSNAITGFSCDAEFEAPAVFSSLLSDRFGDGGYSVKVSDSVAYD